MMNNLSSQSAAQIIGLLIICLYSDFLVVFSLLIPDQT